MYGQSGCWRTRTHQCQACPHQLCRAPATRPAQIIVFRSEFTQTFSVKNCTYNVSTLTALNRNQWKLHGHEIWWYEPRVYWSIVREIWDHYTIVVSEEIHLRVTDGFSWQRIGNLERVPISRCHQHPPQHPWWRIRGSPEGQHHGLRHAENQDKKVIKNKDDVNGSNMVISCYNGCVWTEPMREDATI